MQENDEYIRKQAALNRKIIENPKDPQTWKDLILLQNLLLRDAKKPKTIERIVRVVRDKKIAIYAKALEFLPDELDFVRESLLLAREVDSAIELQTKWQRALESRKGAITLWLDYLQFHQTDATRFTLSDCLITHGEAIKTIFNSAAELNLDPAPCESMLLHVFRRACHLLVDADQTERAIAAFQALIECTFFTPDALKSKSFEVIVDSFQEFWEVGSSRFGEENAEGWNATIQPGVMSSDVNPSDEHPRTYDEWARQESLAKSSGWLPSRENNSTGGPLQDLDRIVLFDDIRSFLFPIRTSTVQSQLINSFLNILGVSTSVVASANHPFFSDQFLNNDLGDLNRVANFWPPRTQHELKAKQEDSHAGDKETISKFRYPSSIFPPTADTAFGWTTWYPYGMMNDGLSTAFDQKSRRNFIRNVFRQARKVVSDVTTLDVMAINFEMSVATKGAKKLARQLLNADRENVVLWNAYAQIERSSGDDDEARKVYQQILSRGGFGSPEMILSIRFYAELEMDNNNSHKAICALVSFAEGSAPDFRVSEDEMAQSPIPPPRMLRAKRFFLQHSEEAVKDLSLSPGPVDAVVENLSCLALLELSTSGPEAAMQVFKAALSSVHPSYPNFPYLPDLRRYTTDPFESLCERISLHAARFLHRAATLRSFNNPVPPSLLRSILEPALTHTPLNTALISLNVFHERRTRYDGRVERVVEGASGTHVGWGVGVWSEAIARGGCSEATLKSILEDAAGRESTRHSVALWTMYVRLEHSLGHGTRAKAVFWRGVRECPWAKELYMLPFTLLRPNFSDSELSSVLDLMVEKEVRVRIEYGDVEGRLTGARAQNKDAGDRTAGWRGDSESDMED
ncbi:DUF1740-domain-containing protein [Gonapodya prolifera JEL478]|uniref:DUF1740-domain-containing protein n=1 Tax=Gonapodya prolifera (strain JEL478) TaxID=1344416 RepID=A0A139AR45_GONPJ|nr:DUF1740-domain-containing protein [Gonapodya prolifera JEL478]|eukprot:KXS19206.1 DUF1740-domain-containing protein [Gonapodya prolifera JEL478]